MRSARVKACGEHWLEAWRLALPTPQEDALELAAKVEAEVAEANAIVRATAASKRHEAEQLEQDAATLDAKAAELAVDPSRISAVGSTIEKRSTEIDALERKVGRAILDARPAAEVERIEAIRDRRRADVETAEAELAALHERTAEVAQLAAHAASLRTQASELRDVAHRLETDGVKKVDGMAPAVARQLRAEQERLRELQRRVVPKTPPSPSELVPNEIVLEGPVRGISGLIKV